MQEYTSKQHRIQRPAEQIFAAVSRFDNLTPAVADRVEEWQATEDTCSFKAKGFTVKLRIAEKEAPKYVKIESDEGGLPVDFSFWIQLQPVAAYDTRMRLVLRPLGRAVLNAGRIRPVSCDLTRRPHEKERTSPYRSVFPPESPFHPTHAITQRMVGKVARRRPSSSEGGHQTTRSIPSSRWGDRAQAPSKRISNQRVRLSSHRPRIG